MDIIRNSVRSSQISSIGYDEPSQTLEVQFLTGGVYRYAAVPSDVAFALVNAQSIGTHFGQNIRNKYATTKRSASGEFEPLETCHASPASVALLLRLLAEKGFHKAGRDGFPRPEMNEVFDWAGKHPKKTPRAVRENVGQWLDSLTQRQCSAAIEFLKDVRT